MGTEGAICVRGEPCFSGYVDQDISSWIGGVWVSNSTTLTWCYRILGATIRENVKIRVDADIVDFNLVTIGDGAVVEMSTLRGFAVDNGCMLLAPVAVGSFACVGVESVAALYPEIRKGFISVQNFPATIAESEALSDATT